jgi:hypothetical protein
VIIDGTVQTLTHDLDNPTILLAGFSSFEGTMAIVSMSKQNEISVIPQGLGMLTKLVLYVDTIKQYLNEYINNHNLQPAFVAQCKGESEIKSFLANLGSNTDIDILNQYANLTSHDEEEFKKNELEISRLHTINKSH